MRPALRYGREENRQMPNLKSAKKRLRTAEKAGRLNRIVRRQVRRARRAVLEAIAAGDLQQVEERFRRFTSAIDKAVKKRVYARGTADRYKQRLAARIRSLRRAA